MILIGLGTARSVTGSRHRGNDELTGADMVKPVIDIPLSRAFDTTWAAMEKLVDQGKTRMIGKCSISKTLNRGGFDTF